MYKTKAEILYPYIFFILGGLTTFFDLLTAPILTLGMPLLCVILLKHRQGIDIKKLIIEIIKVSILWCIAYITIFLSKWIIASIALQKNVIKVAIDSILFRVNGNNEYPTTRFGAIYENLKYLYNSALLFMFIVIVLIWGVVMIKNKKNIKNMKIIIPVLLVAMYPYIWYFTFAGHSSLHSYFTYRAQAVAIFGMLCAMIECIDSKKTSNIGRIKWKK